MNIIGYRTEEVLLNIDIDAIVECIMKDYSTLEDCIDAFTDDMYYYLSNQLSFIPADVEISIDDEDTIIEAVTEKLEEKFND